MDDASNSQAWTSRRYESWKLKPREVQCRHARSRWAKVGQRTVLAHSAAAAAAAGWRRFSFLAASQSSKSSAFFLSFSTQREKPPASKHSVLPASFGRRRRRLKNIRAVRGRKSTGRRTVGEETGKRRCQSSHCSIYSSASLTGPRNSAALGLSNWELSHVTASKQQGQSLSSVEALTEFSFCLFFFFHSASESVAKKVPKKVLKLVTWTTRRCRLYQ